MIGINKIILLGTVGRNPETKYLKKGVSYSRFSLATTELVNSVFGNQVEETEWHEIVATGELSDYVSQFVKKGDTLQVEGRLKSRFISNVNSVGHRIFEVLANTVKIVKRSAVYQETPIEPMPIDNTRVGYGLPKFDIENIPVDLEKDAEDTPF